MLTSEPGGRPLRRRRELESLVRGESGEGKPFIYDFSREGEGAKTISPQRHREPQSWEEKM